VGTLYKTGLLFVMNWLDAQLTILWIRLNVATEANSLMATLLNQGEGQFLFVKVLIGAFAACVLYRCAHLGIARRGLQLVLGIYFVLMLVHVVTGFTALGWKAPQAVLGHFFGLH
jgi:hypothetical protein